MIDKFDFDISTCLSERLCRQLRSPSAARIHRFHGYSCPNVGIILIPTLVQLYSCPNVSIILTPTQDQRLVFPGLYKFSTHRHTPVSESVKVLFSRACFHILPHFRSRLRRPLRQLRKLGKYETVVQRCQCRGSDIGSAGLQRPAWTGKNFYLDVLIITCLHRLGCHLVAYLP